VCRSEVGRGNAHEGVDRRAEVPYNCAPTTKWEADEGAEVRLDNSDKPPYIGCPTRGGAL
jgi:hypothetical protein